MAERRIVDPTGTYHVMSRGNYRRTIFPDVDHATRYLFLLNRVAQRRRWIVVDWCLMPNHFHLLIRLTNDGLSAGMRELNGCYSRWSNAVREVTGTGHLVRNRFKSRLVDTDSYRLHLLRYIPLNPVKAKLTTSPSEWRWSGYRAIVGLEHPHPFHRPEEVLRTFGSTPLDAQRAYQSHVISGLVATSLGAWSDDEGPRR
jgi:REP element-mobilizing transposase RayT